MKNALRQLAKSPAFTAVAVLLAAPGIYGVLAFSVGERTPEFGVALGLAGYLALSWFIGTLLFNLAPTDPATLIAAPLALALVAFAACLLPARRATKVDPMIGLRAE
jgi:putative ABC transport system permease protein